MQEPDDVSNEHTHEPGTPRDDQARAEQEIFEVDETAGDEAGDSSAAADSNGEVAQLREAMLRMRADIDNREKRMEREMVKARKFAIEALLRDLVPVLDSMDQALAAGDAGAAEGMLLTQRLALKALSDHGLEVLDPLGEPFDPSWHEAMTTQPAGEQPVDTITQVLQKGYRLNERLVRPARVIVAK
jgi:molecular chaperone GrpE